MRNDIHPVFGLLANRKPRLLRAVWCGLALAGLVALLPAGARAQASDSLAAGAARQLQRHQQRTLVEKLYVHLDRTVYTARETMWLKLYAVDGTFHRPLDLSSVAYVEVLNALGQPVLQTQVALRDATGRGALDLPATLPTGRYVVRAYTSWMKNFDPAFYFHTPVTIINTFAASGAPAGAPKAPAYDAQFFPEGGQLVQGVPGRVAFRVTDAAGRGQAVAGTVRDGQGRAVATFRTLQFGLGSFVFTPALGATYAAEMQLVTGQKLVQPLPAAAAQGYALRLTEASPGQLRLHVVAKGVGADAAHLALVGHSGQRVATAQVAQPNAHGEVDFLIATAELLPGVSHFTVFNSRRQPVGERLYFQRPRALPVAVAASQARYGLRDKVTLRLTGPPSTAANCSLAVYQLDSLTAGAAPADISSVLSLTSDLKGHVENPGYYLRDSSQTGQAAADNLMLTHGWSRFRWADVLADKAPALPYAPEPNGPVLRAQVLTAAGAPAPGVVTYLAAPSRIARFYTATSGPDGIAQFAPKDADGPRLYTLQTDWRRDSTYQLALLSPYSARFAAYPLAPLGLGPALAADLTRRHLQTQLQATYYGRYQQLQRLPRDTVAFYGTPPAQYRLDDYTRFKTLEEVLREYVQGVYVRQGPRLLVADQFHRTLFEDAPLVLLDGVPMFDVRKFLAFDPLRIQRVAVFTNRYFYGSQSFGGLLSFTTYQGDLQDFPLDARALLEEYTGVQGAREFFAPRYDGAPSPLPDLRNLLHWQPDLALAPGATREITFYTSDQTGRYQVVVQGLGANGQAGTARTVFEVKPAL
ncbi:hypothetical protein [Hymenobacter nivis]|uniref:Macroglobulin domain-containing protein n=1 Tax=Hymenobacter nivis TaxID=1850093 RepID=A0A502HF37_9BACT|nr:hypothetical protein [Hymenobacter nivis]TPG71818.1 hypothetical protein EAH73_00760 [Hymenobacter nivis]